MKKLIIIPLVLLSFFVLIDSAEAALSCQIRDSDCIAGETPVFRMSGLTNAHAEMSAETNYNYRVCCSGIAGLGNDCGAANKATVLRLSGVTNAHVERNDHSPQNYFHEACLSITNGLTMTCSYNNNCSNLGDDYVCLASVSGNTNAHVGECAAYPTKVCCAATVDPPSPGTCQEHNVWGWAWANMERVGHDPTIGWISFSCTNTMAIGTGVDYGVDIDPTTGNFSGHAWVGWEDGAGVGEDGGWWIDFAPPGPYPAAGPDYSAKFSTTTGQVSGWARACPGAADPDTCSGGPNPAAGGWDGWIKLGSSPHESWHIDGGQQVYIDAATDPAEFHGWAWGDDVVGWISFNTDNYAGGEDYKVMTDFSFAPPPSLPYIESAISTDEYCNIFAGVGQVDFEWTYRHDDGYDQASYHLQVADDSMFGNKLVDYEVNQTVSPNGKGSSAILIVENPGTNPNCGVGDSFEGRCVAYGFDYWWQVKVKDENDNWSVDWEPDPSASFTVPVHAYPWVDFEWSPDRPEINQEVQFEDRSIAFGGASMAGWSWTFQDGTPAASSLQNPTTTFSLTSDNEVYLYACDDTPLVPHGGPYCCPKTKDVNIRLPLPEYREVRPRSQLDNFLARLSSIFTRF